MCAYRIDVLSWGSVLRLACRLLFLLGLFPAPAALAAPPAGGAQQVSIGVFINDLAELDLKEGTCYADFYLWLRWTGSVSPTGFEFMNAVEASKERNFYDVIDGVKYAVYRCKGKFRNRFEFGAYPLDRHTLSIEVEDPALETSDLVYLPDTANTSIQEGARLTGWELGKPGCSVKPWVYATSYGEPGVPPDHKATYSRFVVELPIRHASLGIYLKSFLALFISVAIAFLSALLAPSEVEARLGLGVAAIFGAVSSHILVAQTLPETPHFTLADKIHVISMFFVFLSLLASAAVFHFDRVEQEKRAARLNLTLGILLPAAFTLLVFVLTSIA